MAADVPSQLTAAVAWWSAKRRDLAALLSHDESPALVEQFLKVHAVVTALERASAGEPVVQPAQSAEPAQPAQPSPRLSPSMPRRPY